MFGIVCTPYARTSDGLPAKAPRAGKLRKGHKLMQKKKTQMQSKILTLSQLMQNKNINPADQRIEKDMNLETSILLRQKKQTGLKDALVPDMSE